MGDSNKVAFTKRETETVASPGERGVTLKHITLYSSLFIVKRFSCKWRLSLNTSAPTISENTHSY